MMFVYVTKNVFQTHAVYEDGTDMHFFHSALLAAKYKYQLLTESEDFTGQLDESDIDRIKKYETPVFYMTTVSKYTKDDVRIARTEMNKRGRSKFIVIDADFDPGEERQSDYLRKQLIELADNHQTPIVIYPSISYPLKPRFRAVLFTSRQLNENTYYKAVKWLYDTIGLKAKDIGDYQIKSPNNCPVFVNDRQIKAVYDTTQSDGLKPLDNALWKDFDDKPKKDRKAVPNDTDNILDEYEFTDMDVELIGEMFKAAESIKYYNQFWPLMHSVARAEFNEQLTQTQAETLLEHVADIDEERHLVEKWKKDNVVRYNREKTRVFQSQDYLDNAVPLLLYDEALLIVDFEGEND